MTGSAAWTTIGLLLTTAWLGGAQQTAQPPLRKPAAEPIVVFGRAHAPLDLRPDATRLAHLRTTHTPVGDWGGAKCPSLEQMRSLVDGYIASNGFDVLKAYGLKRNTSAVIGGNLVFRDLESSFGNTG